MLTSRQLDILGLLLAASFLAAAAWLQDQVALRPCPLCLLARYAIAWLGGLHLVGTVWQWSPSARTRLNSTKGVTAFLGIALSLRQHWVEHQNTLTCQADIVQLGDTLGALPGLKPFIQWLFSNSSECSASVTQFLKLNLSTWTLLGFSAFLVLALRQQRYLKAKDCLKR